MQLSDIDLTSLAKIHGTGNVPKPSVYHNDQYFYKVIHEVSKYTRTSLGYYVLDGLDFKWAGQEQMAIDAVGLLSDKIAPAFKEFIYDREICCGYITHRGQWLGEETLSSTEYIKYLTFIKDLADASIESGYAIVSANQYNTISYNGKLSLIDLDFSPIKLKHGKIFSPDEQQLWENEFRSYDGIYLNMIKERIT